LLANRHNNKMLRTLAIRLTSSLLNKNFSYQTTE
jgi:hypothetical protein